MKHPEYIMKHPAFSTNLLKKLHLKLLYKTEMHPYYNASDPFYIHTHIHYNICMLTS